MVLRYLGNLLTAGLAMSHKEKRDIHSDTKTSSKKHVDQNVIKGCKVKTLSFFTNTPFLSEDEKDSVTKLLCLKPSLGNPNTKNTPYSYSLELPLNKECMTAHGHKKVRVDYIWVPEHDEIFILRASVGNKYPLNLERQGKRLLRLILELTNE